jgi:predicted flap endonuclease-1-like 5' DNA nuclease
MSDDEKAKVIAELRRIPGVGENAAEGLYKLGVRSAADLQGKDAAAMYDELRNMKGSYAEPCMLNSFKIAVKASEKK